MYCTPVEKPKAKKQHRCMSCGESIAVGEIYYRWRTYECGDAGTNRMHPECYEMHSNDAVCGQWEYTLYEYERPMSADEVSRVHPQMADPVRRPQRHEGSVRPVQPSAALDVHA
jgi:predicted RNA-binding Zn-ribbon protein involved in translation (DUF1610 family)